MVNSTLETLHGLLKVTNDLDGGIDIKAIMDAKRNLTYPDNVHKEPYVIIVLKAYHDVISLPGVRYSLVTILSVFTILALAGNALVIVVIRRRRSLCRNPAIIFISNLAICELVSCLIYRPMLVVDILMPYTSHGLVLRHQIHICRAAMLLQTLIAGVGFHTIVAISQERLCLIVYPLKAKVWFSSGRSKKVLVLIWLVSAGIAVPIPVKFAKLIIANVEGTSIAYCGLFEYTTTGKIYIGTLFVLYFALPSVILAVSYTKIFNTLYRRSSNLALASENKGSSRQMKSRRSLAKMMLAVAVLFCICWGPHFAYFIHIALGGHVPRNGFFIVSFLHILPLVSSTVNPILYTMNSRTFRSSFKSLFRSSSSAKSDDSMARTFNGIAGRNTEASFMHSPYLTRSTSTSRSSSARVTSGHFANRMLISATLPAGNLTSSSLELDDCLVTRRHYNTAERNGIRQNSFEAPYDLSPNRSYVCYRPVENMEDIGEATTADCTDEHV